MVLSDLRATRSSSMNSAMADLMGVERDAA